MKNPRAPKALETLGGVRLLPRRAPRPDVRADIAEIREALAPESPLVFLDFEATGLDIVSDRIVEISAVRAEPSGDSSSLDTLVDPGAPIPVEATVVHGIDDAAVAGAPRFEQVASALRDWLDGGVLAGYNLGRYDLPLLEAEFGRAGVRYAWRDAGLLDVSVIFRRMEPRSLSGALRFYRQRELADAHAASADVAATMAVLVGQLRRYPDLSRDLAELDRFTRPRERD